MERPEGGGGRTRVIENGKVLRKGGVNISAVHGKLPEAMQKNVWRRRSRFLCLRTKFGITPKNPMVPQFMPIGVILKCTMIAEK
jgi:coproporphyrinogen III oxidase